VTWPPCPVTQGSAGSEGPGAHPDGLLPGELAAILGTLVRSERCVGFNLTIYDPDLDPDGSCAALLADILQRSFAPS
jgi:arginase family enzyme